MLIRTVFLSKLIGLFCVLIALPQCMVRWRAASRYHF